MLIQCTIKLLDKLNIKPQSQPEEEALFSWHANLVTVYGGNAVVLVNDKNRYVIVLHGLNDKHFKNLDEYIIEAIKMTLSEDGFDDVVVEKFINHSKGITYTNTKNRSMVTKMNKACEILDYHEELFENKSIYKTAMSRKANEYTMGNYKNGFIYPSEEMHKELENFI